MAGPDSRLACGPRRELVHGLERGGVVGARPLGLRELERLHEERDGQVQIPGSPVGPAEDAHGHERVGVVGPDLGLLELERLLGQERDGQVQIPGLFVHLQP